MESSDFVSINPNVECIEYVQRPSTAPTQNELVILYVNICSAPNKWDLFEAYLAHLPIAPDVVVMAETWLNEGEEKFFNINGFAAFHCVGEKVVRRGRGGGSAIFVRNRSALQPIQLEKICLQDSTILCVRLNKIDVNVIAVYRPEQTQQGTFRDTLSDLLSRRKRSICVGDFNINIRERSSNTSRYVDMLLCHGFTILNSLS